MTDELQDALTSAQTDPMEVLKSDIGMTDAAPKTEPKQEKPEAKADEKPAEDAENDAKSNDEANADNDEQPKNERKRNSYETKLRRQAAANRSQLEQINELKAKLEKYESAQASEAKSEGPVKPNMDNFDSYEDYDKAVSEYNDAMIDYKAEQRFKERQQQVEQERLQAEQAAQYQKMEQAFQEREARFKATHKNYDRNAQNLVETLEYLTPESKQSQVLREFVAKSELGPNLIHHLGENTDLIEDIASMGDPLDAVRELVMLEQSLSKKPADGKSLPAPINKLKTTPEGESSLLNMPWEKMRETIK